MYIDTVDVKGSGTDENIEQLIGEKIQCVVVYM